MNSMRRRFIFFMHICFIISHPNFSYAKIPSTIISEELKIYENFLDGYRFKYPVSWEKIATSGNNVFCRNPANPTENLLVEVSSIASTKFETIKEMGNLNDVAERMLRLYIRVKRVRDV